MIPYKSSQTSLPEWLEAFRIPDSLISKAYDNFTPIERSLIKTAIALANYHYSEKNNYKETSKADFDSGFSTHITSSPVNWTAIIFSQNFDSAALTCSAAILPVLYGVNPVFAICLNESPAPSVLTALELCGVENIFYLDEIKCLSLIRELSSSQQDRHNSGRVIILDSDQNLEELVSSIKNYQPVFFHNKAPVVCIQNSDSEFKGSLKTILGSNYKLTNEPSESDACYIDGGNFPKNPASFLTLSMPCMGFWIFPNLESDFFKTRTFCFNMIESEPDF